MCLPADHSTYRCPSDLYAHNIIFSVQLCSLPCKRFCKYSFEKKAIQLHGRLISGEVFFNAQISREQPIEQQLISRDYHPLCLTPAGSPPAPDGWVIEMQIMKFHQDAAVRMIYATLAYLSLFPPPSSFYVKCRCDAVTVGRLVCLSWLRDLQHQIAPDFSRSTKRKAVAWSIINDDELAIRLIWTVLPLGQLHPMTDVHVCAATAAVSQGDASSYSLCIWPS